MNKYFSFRGNATRSEYWAVMCISTLVVLFAILAPIIFIGTESVPGMAIIATSMTIVILTVAWAQLATIARRCRDIDISPWFCLTTYIPYVGLIVLIIFGCLISVKKDNNGPH